MCLYDWLLTNYSLLSNSSLIPLWKDDFWKQRFHSLKVSLYMVVLQLFNHI